MNKPTLEPPLTTANSRISAPQQPAPLEPQTIASAVSEEAITEPPACEQPEAESAVEGTVVVQDPAAETPFVSADAPAAPSEIPPMEIAPVTDPAKATPLQQETASIPESATTVRTVSAETPVEEPLAPVYRTWTDATGVYKLEAALVAVENGTVKLQRKDGGRLAVPLENLSAADQAFAQHTTEE